ncbi:GNAT family N-acetyltransferase [Kitasatospora sp. HPMI-4]|uniref:GNAT family N-acetyltransferase n=1 Tax=Kitasatospora sp. HPMI-4 TaxID=3448443 RepID=UPI003F1CE3BF
MIVRSADPAVTNGYAHLENPPSACWVAEEGTEVVGRVAVDTVPEVFASTPGARVLVGLWWQTDRLDAARAVLRAAVGSLAPGETLDLRTHAEVHPHLPERLALARECGFTLFQEKQGYLWTDEGEPLPAPEHLTTRPLTEMGATRFAEVLAACQAGTLDRADRAHGQDVTALMELYDPAEDGTSWLVAENSQGRTVGAVAVSAFDEEGIATIVHIGVLPEHRGRGYVDDLLRAAQLAARRRGFGGMLSDTDVENHPMRAAFLRTGHRGDARPWHVWHHTVTAG